MPDLLIGCPRWHWVLVYKFTGLQMIHVTIVCDMIEPVLTIM